ncbi:MAG: HAMP domain-containing sensor histidine kinase [Sulfurimonas sp.]|nr:HAMP domain-containing sensor histidine kinase [Sulfurimonas sp.]
MNKVEIESFVKSFLLFFLSLSSLLVAVFIINQQKTTHILDESILADMRLCSFDLKCPQYDIVFVEKNSQNLYSLYKSNSTLSSYYGIPKSEKYLMQISLSANKYAAEVEKLEQKALWNFFIILAILFFLSILFSIYALYPLRNALLLTHEFIRDILHDFNTPLSSLRLNSAMLEKELGANTKITRIQQSVQNILNLQQHLRSYLEDHSLQKELLDLQKTVEERVQNLKGSYPNIAFDLHIDNVDVFTSKEAFERILDNILSNAAKYNRHNGFVKISFDQQSLHIEDSGKGIKNPKRIFERFYKEQERGIGIGLHIVKKLCEELAIKINVQSEPMKGTTITLDLSKLMLH